MNPTKLISIALLCSLLGSYSAYSKENESKVKLDKAASENLKKETKKLYKTVDKNGKIRFSDQPSPGAKVIVMEEVNSIKMEKPNVDIESLVEENQIKRDPNADYYRVMNFQDLENDGVVRNNGGTVPMTVTLEPTLSKSHFLRFYIDGKMVGNKQKELTFIASNIEYGPHVAHFDVISSNGKVVQQSAKVRFNLLHVVRKRVGNLNSLTNDIHNTSLPQHPKVPTYESMKKTDN